MTNYEPILRENPKCFTGMASAWGDIPTILKDIITRFNLKTDKALEFGVEYGYSTTAIANYFDEVIGVDNFSKYGKLKRAHDNSENFKLYTLLSRRINLDHLISIRWIKLDKKK